MLGPNDFTLTPLSVADAAAFPVFPADADAAPSARRHVVTFTDRVVLTDEWQLVAAVTAAGDPVAVEVRAADCGLGCRCAGEYRLAIT